MALNPRPVPARSTSPAPARTSVVAATNSNLHAGAYRRLRSADAVNGRDGEQSLSARRFDGPASLDTAAPFARNLWFFGELGCFFESRATASAKSAAHHPGGFPVNYPYTWLRLRRAGDVFTGFASFDGQSWIQIGTATISLPAQLYLGCRSRARTRPSRARQDFAIRQNHELHDGQFQAPTRKSASVQPAYWPGHFEIMSIPSRHLA